MELHIGRLRNDMVMLFAGSCYYPYGGWEDFQGYFNTIDEAKIFLLNNWESFGICCSPWAHIVEENKIVLQGIFDDSFTSLKNEWKFEMV